MSKNKTSTSLSYFYSLGIMVIMKKIKKIWIGLSVFLVVVIVLTIGFLYLKNTENIEYDLSQTFLEYDQLKVAEDQAKQFSQAVSSTVASTVNSSEVKNLSSKNYNVHFGILMYHHIDYKAKRLSVRPEILDAQIKYLLDQGYKIIKLSEAFKNFSLASTTPGYNKTLVLTFDDGYRDFYLNAYPVLKKYNVPASFYVINQDIGRPGNVTWEMIKQLDKEGLVEIGVHTVNHKPLGKLKPESAYYQMSKSKELLEKGLGHPGDTIVYPFGSFNTNVKKQAKDIGFIGAASVYFGDRPSSKDMYAWRRAMITNTDIGVVLLSKIFIAFELVK